jgi:prepilin-type N-terminal cleavage/methylation domain-containing protein
MKGFTIIEMIVVTLIIGLIASLSIANYHAGERISNLLVEGQKLVTILKQIQNMALTGYRLETEQRPECGYGIKFLNNSYFTFIENSSPCDYSYSNDDILLQNFTLSSGISLYYPNDCQNLVFKPPYGEVCCCCPLDCSFSSDKQITLWQSVENRSLYIRINSIGKISVDTSL